MNIGVLEPGQSGGRYHGDAGHCRADASRREPIRAV
jgi:hypothetical protein